MTFEHALARWLPRQRWYPGQGDTAGKLTVLADTMLAVGDPGLRHLIVELRHPGTGSLPDPRWFRADVPVSLNHTVIGPTDDGLIAYDALHDPPSCLACCSTPSPPSRRWARCTSPSS